MIKINSGKYKLERARGKAREGRRYTLGSGYGLALSGANRC